MAKAALDSESAAQRFFPALSPGPFLTNLPAEPVGVVFYCDFVMEICWRVGFAQVFKVRPLTG